MFVSDVAAVTLPDSVHFLVAALSTRQAPTLFLAAFSLIWTFQQRSLVSIAESVLAGLAVADVNGICNTAVCCGCGAAGDSTLLDQPIDAQRHEAVLDVTRNPITGTLDVADAVNATFLTRLACLSLEPALLLCTALVMMAWRLLCSGF